MNGPDKINIVIPRDLHKRLRIQGAHHGMSPGIYARKLMEEGLKINKPSKSTRSNRSAL